MPKLRVLRYQVCLIIKDTIDWRSQYGSATRLPISLVILHNTVKPQIFACPLFREFYDLRKFAKITGREYSNVNHLLSTSLIEPSTELTGNGH